MKASQLHRSGISLMYVLVSLSFKTVSIPRQIFEPVVTVSHLVCSSKRNFQADEMLHLKLLIISTQLKFQQLLWRPIQNLDIHLHRHRKTHPTDFHNFLSNQEIQSIGHTHTLLNSNLMFNKIFSNPLTFLLL